MAFDVSNEHACIDAVSQVKAAHGRTPDILVNNAGMVRTSRVMKTDVRVWEEHLKVNLTGAFVVYEVRVTFVSYGTESTRTSQHVREGIERPGFGEHSGGGNLPLKVPEYTRGAC